MKRISLFNVLLLLLVIVTCVSLQAATGGVVPIGAAAGITTDLMLRNVGSVKVTQFLGSHSTPQPDGSVKVETTSADLEVGETHLFKRVDLNFNPGLWILQIDPRLEASVLLDWHNGLTKFECSNITVALTTTGTFFEFHRVVVDDGAATGTWVQTLNLGLAPLGITAVVQGPKKDPATGAYLSTAEFWTAPPGISQHRIATQLQVGGSLKVYDGSPSVGVGASAPVTFFVVTGPTDGGTQAVRYPEAPGS